MWSKLDNQSEITQSAVSGGKLLLQNVQASDSGVYFCLASNVLGQKQARVQLVVNGKPMLTLVLFLFVVVVFLNKS